MGKTKQLLLATALHVFLCDSLDDSGKVVYKTVLLTVLPSLIDEWLSNLKFSWPIFHTVVSYDDHNFKTYLALRELSYSAMKWFPSQDTIPVELRYIFDRTAPRAAKTLGVTSYETHKHRTGVAKIKKIPGERYNPPQHDQNNQELWKKKPRKKITCTRNTKESVACGLPRKFRNCQKNNQAGGGFFVGKVPRSRSFRLRLTAD